MEHVLIVLVMFAGGTHAFFTAAETKCDATKNTSLCSATLGGSVYIQVMPSASSFMLQCKKTTPSSIKVFSVKKDKVTIEDAYRNRTEFFINNGTLRITDVEWSDSGQYSIEVFNSNGIRVKDVTITLDVQENISPILIIVCSAVGALLLVMVISCCAYRKKKRNRKSGQVPNEQY